MPEEPILSDPEPRPGDPASEPAALHTLLAERDAALAAAGETRQVLLERLRAALLASEPALDPELVHGETLEELEASFAAARELVARIREAVRRDAPAPIPPGAPGRTPPQPHTPFAKIRAGLEVR